MQMQPPKKTIGFFGFARAICLFVLIANLAYPNTAHAQRNSASGGSGSSSEFPKTCDPAYMAQLNSKAYLEAQREIEMNARFINKPDSVLALSCFQQSMRNASLVLPEIFSETRGQDPYSPRRAAGNNQFPDHFNANLISLNGNTLGSWIYENYNHPFSSQANGRAGESQGVNVLGRSGQLRNLNPQQNGPYGIFSTKDTNGATFDSPLSGADHGCKWMRDLWELAKCGSFDLKDDFTDVAFAVTDTNESSGKKMQFAYQDLRGKSCGTLRRQFRHGGNRVNEENGEQPRETVSSGDTYNHIVSSISLQAAEKLQNNGGIYFDDIVSNFNTILDRQSAGGCKGEAIPTGITVKPLTGTGNSYPEKFCPNPGCSYDKTACVPVN